VSDEQPGPVESAVFPPALFWIFGAGFTGFSGMHPALSGSSLAGSIYAGSARAGNEAACFPVLRAGAAVVKDGRPTPPGGRVRLAG